MRKALADQNIAKQPQSHFGLAYDMLAPVETSGEHAGKVANDERANWLRHVENTCISPHYAGIALERWNQALKVYGATTANIKSTSRILIGSGNPSATEVGLTVEHTWGTPRIPGSSLKGLLHHYLVDKYGPSPESWTHDPASPDHPESERAPFQPVTWKNNNPHYQAGEAIRTIFGSPASGSGDEPNDAESDTNTMNARGVIEFLDAWWIPGKTSLNAFATDILNPHHRDYYSPDNSSHWPNDYESPVPVQFMTITPGQVFLLAINGEKNLAEWVMKELLEALKYWGVGAKTMAGYGCFELRGKIRQLQPEIHIEADPVVVKLEEYIDGKTSPTELGTSPSAMELIRWLVDVYSEQLRLLDTEQRPLAAKALEVAAKKNKKKLNKKAELSQQLNRLITEFTEA